MLDLAPNTAEQGSSPHLGGLTFAGLQRFAVYGYSVLTSRTAFCQGMIHSFPCTKADIGIAASSLCQVHGRASATASLTHFLKGTSSGTSTNGSPQTGVLCDALMPTYSAVTCVRDRSYYLDRCFIRPFDNDTCSHQHSLKGTQIVMQLMHQACFLG